MNRPDQLRYKFICSILDSILNVIADMNQRLNYVINVCLRREKTS